MAFVAGFGPHHLGGIGMIHVFSGADCMREAKREQWNQQVACSFHHMNFLVTGASINSTPEPS
jgi:hypothetical protein